MTPSPRHTVRVWLPLPDALGRGLDPQRALERLRGRSAPWLLESALREPGDSRFSFCGADPYLVLRSRGPRLVWGCHRVIHEGLAALTQCGEGCVLDALRAVLPAAPADDGPALPFCGGAVGAFGYALAEQIDVHRIGGEDDLGLPDAVWLFVDALIAFDHARGTAGISALGMADAPAEAGRRAQAAGERLLAALVEGPPPAPRRRLRRNAPAGEATAGLDLGAYRKAVDTVKEGIAAGDLYQACLTYRVDAPFDGDPWQLYRRLCARDPAPYACFLELDDLCVVGSSPERFLRVDADGVAESRPIKGTARRGADPVADAAAREALANSAKDRAENLMIVDLVRNDLGRVCETGSVDVPELFGVESRAEVHHLVSTVRGRLRPDRDALDAVAACFPPGSMTGAPKIAAMRLLDRLERHRRGFYAGALGYLDARGGADLAVVIRTAFVRDGRVFLHSGGGIVADSDPAAEYAESRDKLRALRRALGGI